MVPCQHNEWTKEIASIGHWPISEM